MQPARCSKRRFVMLSAVLVGLLGGVVEVRGGPATNEVSADFSTPLAAVRSLRLALEKCDPVALNDAVYASDDTQRRLVEAYVAVVLAGKRVADATAARFGATGEPIARGGLSLDDLKESDAATLTVTGDSASLLLPGRDGRRLILRRDRAGVWRVDLLEYAGVNPTDAPSQRAMLLDLAHSLDEVAPEIADGRYRTLDDVRAVLVEKFHSSAARSLRPTTHPTTAPTTRAGP